MHAACVGVGGRDCGGDCTWKNVTMLASPVSLASTRIYATHQRTGYQIPVVRVGFGAVDDGAVAIAVVRWGSLASNDRKHIRSVERWRGSGELKGGFIMEAQRSAVNLTSE